MVKKNNEMRNGLIILSVVFITGLLLGLAIGMMI